VLFARSCVQAALEEDIASGGKGAAMIKNANAEPKVFTARCEVEDDAKSRLDRRRMPAQCARTSVQPLRVRLISSPRLRGEALLPYATHAASC